MTRDGMTRLPKKWPSEDWAVSWVPGVEVDGVIYVSGITASDPEGEPVGVGDIGAQTRRCFEKLADVLGRAGATLADVAKLTTYLTPAVGADGIRAYFEARAEFFSTDGIPASTGITVHSLRRAEYLVEIDAIAHRPRR